MHELRQPLFVIKVSAELGLVGDHAAARNRLERIMAQVDHMTAILDRHSGRLQEPTRSDLAAITREVLAQFRELTDGVAVTVQGGAEALWVAMRPLAARQVMINLLKNAVDAAKMQRDPRVWVVLSRDAGRPLWRIRDSGPGLGGLNPADLIAPYATTKVAGTGLGLHVVQTLIQEAGGSFRLFQGPMGGAVAEFEVPPADIS